MHFREAKETWTPTDLKVVQFPGKTCAQANAETTHTMLVTCSDEDLADLIDRLRRLYLVQIDLADDTLRSLIKAQGEQRNRRHG